MAKPAKQQYSLRVQCLDDNNEVSGLPITASGRAAWALKNLIAAGEHGCTPIDHPGPRWSHYTYLLRKKMGFTIETVHEKHGGTFSGTHARYKLHSKVEILEDNTGATV